MRGVFAVAALLAATVRAGDDVHVLTDSSGPNIFEDFILENPLVLVEFYAPWCGHCKALGPKYEKAATRLAIKGHHRLIAKVDATAETACAGKHEVSGYPTLKLFKHGKMVADYPGERTTEALVGYMEKQLARLDEPDEEVPQDPIIELHEDNFEDMLVEHELILVQFMASWCPVTAKIKKNWVAAGNMLRENGNNATLATINAPAYMDIVETYDMAKGGLPRFALFKEGIFEEEYPALKSKAARSAQGFYDYMNKLEQEMNE